MNLFRGRRILGWPRMAQWRKDGDIYLGRCIEMVKRDCCFPLGLHRALKSDVGSISPGKKDSQFNWAE